MLIIGRNLSFQKRLALLNLATILSLFFLIELMVIERFSIECRK